MRIGILSDIHGNLIALKKCFKIMMNKGVDQVVFLGDAVGYYPQGVEVLEFLNNHEVTCILGNHEAMLLDQIPCPRERDRVYKLSAIKDNLPFAIWSFLRSLKTHHEMTFGNKKALFLHGGPNGELTEYIYPDSELSSFLHQPYDFFFIGHTHYPFVRTVDEKLIVNVGSCGLPRDTGNMSSFAIFDSNTSGVEMIRTEMDIEIYKRQYYDLIHESVFKLYDRK